MNGLRIALICILALIFNYCEYFDTEEPEPPIEYIYYYGDVVINSPGDAQAYDVTFKDGFNYSTAQYYIVIDGDLIIDLQNTALLSFLSDVYQITGDVHITEADPLSYLSKLDSVGGEFNLQNISSLNGLENIRYIGGNAFFNLSGSTIGLDKLEYVGGALTFVGEPGEVSINGFNKLNHIQFFKIENRQDVTMTLSGFNKIDTIELLLEDERFQKEDYGYEMTMAEEKGYFEIYDVLESYDSLESSLAFKERLQC
jgi:hypothetical protein